MLQALACYWRKRYSKAMIGQKLDPFLEWKVVCTWHLSSPSVWERGLDLFVLKLPSWVCDASTPFGLCLWKRPLSRDCELAVGAWPFSGRPISLEIVPIRLLICPPMFPFQLWGGWRQDCFAAALGAAAERAACNQQSLRSLQACHLCWVRSTEGKRSGKWVALISYTGESISAKQGSHKVSWVQYILHMRCVKKSSSEKKQPYISLPLHISCFVCVAIFAGEFQGKKVNYLSIACFACCTRKLVNLRGIFCLLNI